MTAGTRIAILILMILVIHVLSDLDELQINLIRDVLANQTLLMK